MLNLIATKLRRPIVPAKRVLRPQLLRRLNEGLAASRPLTLVSAPAGFGKTLCVGEWAGELGVPVAWLSLEAEDDDAGRFFLLAWDQRGVLILDDFHARTAVASDQSHSGMVGQLIDLVG